MLFQRGLGTLHLKDTLHFKNMDFLGTPDIGALAFFGLMSASLVTSFIGVFTGAAGGIVLLGLMATAMPPLALIPVHTVVMLGSGATRTMIMWGHVMRPAVLPFVIGSLMGAAAGGGLWVALSSGVRLFDTMV